VSQGRLRGPVPEKLRIEMSVWIDKTRCDDLAGRVNFAACCFRDLADPGDTVSTDGEVGLIAGQAGPIDNRTIADNEIIYGAVSLRSNDFGLIARG
jgi:hypothetical protein